MKMCLAAPVAVFATLIGATAFAQAPEPEPAPAPPAPEPVPEAPPPPAPEPPPPVAPAPPPVAPAPAPVGFSFGASTAPQADQGAPAAAAPAKPKKKKLIWRGTSLTWEQTAATDTVGVGQDVQSRNPSYDWTFSLGPRLYVYDDDDQSVSLRAGVSLTREFTNSDGTTQEGEWLFGDVGVSAGYGRTLHEDGDYSTSLALTLPSLGLPTSKSSANNGTYLKAGASVGIDQAVPVLGSDADVFQTATAGVSVGYSHTFTEATTPTNDTIDRTRITPAGPSLPSDQLSAGLRAEHSLNLGLSTGIDISDQVGLGFDFTLAPSWKYAPTETEVCITTGCVEPGGVKDPQTQGLITGFQAAVNVAVLPQMALQAGYANQTLQNGDDGQHRPFFYSPDARFFLSIAGKLDKIYETLSEEDEKTAKAKAKKVAKR